MAKQLDRKLGRMISQGGLRAKMMKDSRTTVAISSASNQKWFGRGKKMLEKMQFAADKVIVCFVFYWEGCGQIRQEALPKILDPISNDRNQ